MALLPRVPDGWLADDPTNDIGFDMPYAGDNPGAGNFSGDRGILFPAGSDRMPPGTSLSLLMEPHEIAAVSDCPGIIMMMQRNLIP